MSTPLMRYKLYGVFGTHIKQSHQNVSSQRKMFTMLLYFIYLASRAPMLTKLGWCTSNMLVSLIK